MSDDYTGPWLYIGLLDGDGPVRLAYCADEDAVRNAVRDDMFFVSDEGQLAESDEAIVAETAEDLVREGFVSFEGDPGLRLYRVASTDIVELAQVARG